MLETGGAPKQYGSRHHHRVGKETRFDTGCLDRFGLAYQESTDRNDRVVPSALFLWAIDVYEDHGERLPSAT